MQTTNYTAESHDPVALGAWSQVDKQVKTIELVGLSWALCLVAGMVWIWREYRSGR